MLSIYVSTQHNHVRLILDGDLMPMKQKAKSEGKMVEVDIPKGVHTLNIATFADMAQCNWRRWLIVYWLNLICGEIEITCQKAMQNTIETDCEYQITVNETDAYITYEPQKHRIHASSNVSVQKVYDTSARSQTAWKRIMRYYVLPLYFVAIAIPLLVTLGGIYALSRGVFLVGALLLLISFILWCTVFWPAKTTLQENINLQTNHDIEETR